MATAREIKRRIRSVRNVSQITRALQMVASTKMRRAQERVQQSRPYADELRVLLARLAKVSAEADDPRDDEPDADKRLLQARPVKHVGIALVTPDRGLSGSLTPNTIRYTLGLMNDLQKEYGIAREDFRFIAVGKRGRDFVLRTHLQLLAEFTSLGDVPSSGDIRGIARAVSDAFIDQSVDEWVLVYPKYINPAIQRPSHLKLLPVTAPEGVADEKQTDYFYEPSPAAIFSALLPRYLETLILQPALETVASFYSAQYVAMKNATDNAKDLIDTLTLTYNKARQAAITNQILEVVAGSGDNE